MILLHLKISLYQACAYGNSLLYMHVILNYPTVTKYHSAIYKIQTATGPRASAKA